MKWGNEVGFEQFQPKIEILKLVHKNAAKKIRESGSNKVVDLQIIDWCWPKNYANQNHRFLATSNWLTTGDLDPAHYEQFLESWYGIYAGHVPIRRIDPVKDFNCFMNRLCPTRQSWFYQLIRRQLLDRGYVSLNLDISRGCMVDSTDPAEVFEQYFKIYLKTFEPEHQLAKSIVPYRSFNAEESLQDLIMKSKFSIVIETYFERNEIITLSEKIFRCLKLPRPWVMHAMKHAVKHLRDLGFDVLDDIVDHSYDDIDFGIHRQVAILDQLENLCKLEYNEKLIQRLETAAVHNQNLLQSYLDRFDQDIIASFDRVVEKCLRE